MMIHVLAFAGEHNYTGQTQTQSTVNPTCFARASLHNGSTCWCWNTKLTLSSFWSTRRGMVVSRASTAEEIILRMRYVGPVSFHESVHCAKTPIEHGRQPNCWFEVSGRLPNSLSELFTRERRYNSLIQWSCNSPFTPLCARPSRRRFCTRPQLTLVISWLSSRD